MRESGTLHVSYKIRGSVTNHIARENKQREITMVDLLLSPLATTEQ